MKNNNIVLIKIIYSNLNNFYTKKIFIRHNYKKFFYRKSKIYSEISIELKEIIVGLILGDLYVRRRYKNSNTSFHFKGGLVHKEYLEHLYELFKCYCNKVIRIKNTKLCNKIHQSIYFDTLTNKDFNYYHELFYKDNIKIIPKNISELLTPRSLAY